MKPAHGASSDNELLERCRAGDAEAFGAIYDRYGNILYGTALRMLRRPAQAEDVVQVAFMKLHTKPPQPPVSNLGGWLHRVTTNAALDQLRRRQRLAEQELPERPMSAPKSSTGMGRDIERAVQQLASSTARSPRCSRSVSAPASRSCFARGGCCASFSRLAQLATREQGHEPA